MGNSLLMTTDASYTLNFLIYIQNIFLNQNQSNEEYKYPFFPLKIAFNKDFELKYKDLWGEIAERISKPHSNDMKIFHEEKDLFYQRLFVINSDSLKKYAEIYKSFQVWWDSFAGRFSVERSIDETGQKLYVELAKSLTQSEIKPQRSLNISLIYDECLLANAEVSSYFAVLPIRNFFVKYKELVPKLQDCFY
ncbi:hypothetical protein [Psychrobacillus sp.]|uniref:hypothetical protein n=1 Tax=Psychrobacillus sp. TaxID=1871623 RepID=UPI0028BE8DB5|nr:hypothetical protein [Psychrobacillus sp.]